MPLPNQDNLQELDGLEPPKSIPSIILTDEQQHAVSLILIWMADDLGPRQFKLGGYAGTGKTTIIKFIIAELCKKYPIVVCAFTGKACNVLQRKGVSAQTMHSLMYDVEVDDKTGEVTFNKKCILFPELIIIDEASMISTDLYNDLLSFDKKYLFVGDPGQLEPVGDNPNLMAKPDFVLSKIHRQAESSPIITFATQIRNGATPTIKRVDGLTVRKKILDSVEALTCDQLIVARNKTRVQFNDAIRIAKKLPPNTIIEGEKLICLRNNRNFGTFNGMILYVKKVHGTIKSRKTWTDCIKCDCEDEVGNKYPALPIWKKPFTDTLDEKEYPKSDTVHCTYGYVITCHKSQGSEWNKLLVWDEWMPPKVWDMKRWRYTAITRAAKELIYNI